MDIPRLDANQLQVVEEFVEELRGLGVLQAAARPLRRVCLMFAVPKLGQPGQWRCMADMHLGGQNTCSSCDPIFLPSA